MDKITIDSIEVQIQYKPIKNTIISISPDGNVSLSARIGAELKTLEAYLRANITKIKKALRSYKNQERQPQREYLNKETHYFLGTRYQLEILEGDTNKVELTRSTIKMFLNGDVDQDKRHKLMLDWYSSELKQVLKRLIDRWSVILDVNVESISTKLMRNMWAVCKPKDKSICFNIELAKKPIHCIEYIVVRHMINIITTKHTIYYLDKYLPLWAEHKRELNQLPLGI